MATQLGSVVTQPPSDGITRLRWSPRDKLMATSWDQVCVLCVDGAAAVLIRVVKKGNQQ